MHDQDYSFKREEYLDKRNPFIWDLSSIALEIISAVVLSKVNEKDGVFIVGCILALFHIIHNYENMPYSD